MIDLVEQTIILANKTTKILEWKVCYVTPFGLIEDIDTAVSKCKSEDLNPVLCIKPVCVAYGADGIYETFF